MTDEDLREHLVRVDRSIAETSKLQAEINKLVSETCKLTAEERKLGKDVVYQGVLAASGVLGGIVTLVALLLRLTGKGP